MKKYISFLSLIAAIALQSCDRSDLSLSTEDHTLPRQEISGGGSIARSGNNNDEENSNTSNFETGDDDEPRKDKSHWRIQNDTVR